MDTSAPNGAPVSEQTTPATMNAAGPIHELVGNVCAGLIGYEGMVERLAIGLLTGGHLLIEGPPGLAKTRAVKRLASGLEGSFARIQCTPDLMPADVTGTQVFRPDKGDFEFVKGPIFHALVLVDEINRAPPKVQSALLEAMAEGQVTAGGATQALPPCFMVVATQNSIEHEGTFPLPEAQLDRFLMHVLLTLPDATTEMSILNLVESEATQPLKIEALTNSDHILAARKEVETVHLSPALKDYIVRLVMATREGSPIPAVSDAIEHAVSPRGTLSLAASVRARAYLHGRDYGVPEDVQALAPDVLAHRIIPTWRATANGDTARSLVARLLEDVKPI
ncbi:AAA family ATPase [Hwanghaeella sp.]|uniref:AAA family ATPase n=1 Tax=Hwanghaeella sp. TaxID=2605943 RepID=UPI003CCB7AC8